MEQIRIGPVGWFKFIGRVTRQQDTDFHVIPSFDLRGRYSEYKMVASERIAKGSWMFVWF